MDGLKSIKTRLILLEHKHIGNISNSDSLQHGMKFNLIGMPSFSDLKFIAEEYTLCIQILGRRGKVITVK